MNEIEVLSPAGDFESLKSAIFYGADAIYLGGLIFGMRAGAKNFSYDMLEKAVSLAHENSVKIYLTCNTIPTNDEVNKLKGFLKQADEIGVDALIVADLGTIFEAKKLNLKTQLHISTQFGVVNYKTANALYELGATRVVLARELSLEDIKTIRKNTPKDLELECFVHGAVCMSFSGRCLISSYLTNRDANRGQCAQPCRWKYHLVEEKRPGEYYPVIEDDKGSYILNCKDLCLIDYLDRLYDAGVCSFKIEGRAKSSYYVSIVTNAYKMATNILKDAISKNKEYKLPKEVRDEIYTISHRHYHTGFLFGKPQDGQFFENGGYVRYYNVVAVVIEYSKKQIFCKQKNKFSVGEEIEIISPGIKPIYFTVEKMFDENKNLISCVPNSEMFFYISFDKDIEIKPGSLIRKKLT